MVPYGDAPMSRRLKVGCIIALIAATGCVSVYYIVHDLTVLLRWQDVRQQSVATTLSWVGLAHANSVAFRLGIRAGADIESRNRNGYPMIVYAVASRDAQAVKELVSRGANVNATIDSRTPSSAGETALKFAAACCAETTELLLRHGAEPGGRRGIRPAIISACRARN
jgi:hypothetical protein